MLAAKMTTGVNITTVVDDETVQMVLRWRTAHNALQAAMSRYRDNDLRGKAWIISPYCRIYVSVNRVSIGSDNGLSPIRRQANI